MNARIRLVGALAGAMLATAWMVSAVVRRVAHSKAVSRRALETWDGEGGATAQPPAPPHCGS